jgi:hypothetical protein
MSFNYCSENPSFKMIANPLERVPCTINVGTYHACAQSQNSTPYVQTPGFDNTHCPLYDPVVPAIWGTWHQNCGDQNETAYV